jgi:hypothetical protein
MHLKLSSFVSDLLGVSGRRMLQAVAEGATDPLAVAALADAKLRATPEQSDTPRRAGGLMSWAASKAVGGFI